MKKLLCGILLSGIYSCSSSNKISKQPLRNNGELLGTFITRLDSYDSLNFRKIDYNLNLQQVTLQHLFGIRSSFISDTMALRLIDSRHLEIKYRDSTTDKIQIVKGKFSSKGYFQYFVQRKVIQIPPVISIIYGSRLIDRLRIGISLSGNLVVENKYVSEGNIFIFGNGASYTQLYYFKIK